MIHKDNSIIPAETQFKHHNTTDQLIKNKENWAVQYASPGGSPPTARQFMVKPKKMGASVCVTWQLMNYRQAISRKLQKRE